MATSEADRAYRAALGLPEAGPLPKTLGTVATGGTRGRRRLAARTSGKESALKLDKSFRIRVKQAQPTAPFGRRPNGLTSTMMIERRQPLWVVVAT